MSTTTTSPVTTAAPTLAGRAAQSRPTVWKHGVAAGAAASVVTTVVGAVASAAGVSFADGSGVGIPVAAFAQMTMLFSLIGVALAASLARRAARPRSTFVRTTVALTALSVVPDMTFGFDFASAITLIGLHLTAATIVIPTLASRLARTR